MERDYNYIVIGGNPFRMYTGTVTFTSLSVVAKTQSIKEAEDIVRKLWDDYGGLFLILDANTGEPWT